MKFRVGTFVIFGDDFYGLIIGNHKSKTIHIKQFSVYHIIPLDSFSFVYDAWPGEINPL